MTPKMVDNNDNDAHDDNDDVMLNNDDHDATHTHTSLWASFGQEGSVNKREERRTKRRINTIGCGIVTDLILFPPSVPSLLPLTQALPAAPRKLFRGAPHTDTMKGLN